MAKKDFYLKAASKQYQALQSAKAQALAELESHKQTGDSWAASQTVQQLADIAASEQNLQALANQYVQSQAAPPEPTLEERLHKPVERMDYRDVWDLANRDSKFGVDEASFKAGIAEVARRRARGE